MLRFRQLLNEEFHGKETPSAQRISADIQRIVEDMVNTSCPGLRGAMTLSQAYDLLIQEAFSRYRDRSTLPIAVIATGGYGRRELSPASDIDLLFVTKESPKQDEPLVSAMLPLLWDVAKEVSHKTLGIGEIEAAMRSHVATATSFLDARLICGETLLFDEMMQIIRHYFKDNCDNFISTKIEETGIRHARQGGTVYRSQPDIKEVPGGLRDVQTIRWTGKALEHAGRGREMTPHPLISAEDAEIIEDSLDFFFSVRLVLHYIAGGREDILRLDTHAEVAERLGFEPSAEEGAAQEMMRTYYRHAGAVARAVRLVMTSFGRVEGAERKKRVEQRKRIAGRSFTVVGKELFAANPAVFEGVGGAMEILQAFLLAQKHHVDISNELVKRIHDNLYRVDETFRNDLAASGIFMEILIAPGNIAPILRAMRDSGFLSAYLPAYGSIEGLVVDDPMHEYTVDEHTLFALSAIDTLLPATEGLDLSKRKVLEDLTHPEVLMLAILLHDIGKGKGGAHSERGALIVPQITEQLKLSENIARQVVFLVSNHLLLDTIARTRDIADEKLLVQVAEIAGSAETLDYLYLLTYADASSLGVGAWPSWKDAVLFELYQKVRIILSEGVAPTTKGNDFKQSLLEALPPDIPKEDAMLHVELVPPRYKLEVSVEESIEHLRLIKKVAEELLPGAVTYAVKDNMGEIWIVSQDKPGRVAEIAGSISASGLTIQSATAHTRKDGVILDKFTATIPEGSLLTAPWETARRNILSVLAGEVSVEQLLAKSKGQHGRRQKMGPAHQIETVVTVDNRISDRFTVIDVVCQDRIGLLYDVTRVILANGLDIHFARIATHGAAATDVFYVTASGGGKLTDDTRMDKVCKELTSVIEGSRS